MSKNNNAQNADSEVVEINTEEYQEIISDLLRNPKQGSIQVEGEPGIGKTTIAESVALNKGIRYITKRAASMEPVEIGGYPIPGKDGDRAVMEHLPMKDLPGPDEIALIICDEINRGKPETINAWFRLIEGRGSESWKQNIAKHKIVVLTNPNNGDFSTVSLDSAFVSRGPKYRMIPDVGCWLRFANKVGVDRRLIEFLSYAPKSFHIRPQGENSAETPWPNARTYENLSKDLECTSEKLFAKKCMAHLGMMVGSQVAAFVIDPERPIRAIDVLNGMTPEMVKKFKEHQSDRGSIDKALSAVIDLTNLVNAKYDDAMLPKMKKFYDAIINDEVRTSFIMSFNQHKDNNVFDKVTEGLKITDDAIKIWDELNALKRKKK